jgi:hypothetical protein
MLPLALTVVLFGVRSLQVSPRFLLLGLPLAAITAVAGIDACVAAVLRWWKRPDPALARRWSTALIVIMALMSLVSLRNYYRIPKQPYRQSMAYVDTVKKPGDAIIVVYLAQWGYAYYTRNDPGRAADYHYVRTAAALDSVASAYGPDHTYLVTTLPRVLREAHPDLYQRITDDWVRVKSFPGSIGGGDITIWRRKS